MGDGKRSTQGNFPLPRYLAGKSSGDLSRTQRYWKADGATGHFFCSRKLLSMLMGVVCFSNMEEKYDM
jgi:hypothetical protein